MGSRKHYRALEIKEQKKEKSFATLRNCPTSPRKMRLVADMIRGMEVNKAIDALRFSPKEASIRLEKLLMSAIANWETKNKGERIEEAQLIVEEVFVGQGRTLKRLRPAPQGRAHRIRKRSNHVTITVKNINNSESLEEENQE